MVIWTVWVAEQVALKPLYVLLEIVHFARNLGQGCGRHGLPGKGEL